MEEIDAATEHLADIATGIELQLIELVSRRDAAGASGLPNAALEAAVEDLQDRLAEVAESV